MVKRSKYEEHMERMLSELGNLHQKIDQSEKEASRARQEASRERQELHQQINVQNQKIDLLVQENKELKLTIAQQAQIISEQSLKIVQLETRLGTIEERLNAIDKHLSTIAPLFRDFLSKKESILLDPEYRNIRDAEDQGSFSSAHEILKQTDQYENLLHEYKNAHGAASSFGKRLKDFYTQVLGYNPRVSYKKHLYWPEPELVLTDCVVNSFKKLMLS